MSSTKRKTPQPTGSPFKPPARPAAPLQSALLAQLEKRIDGAALWIALGIFLVSAIIRYGYFQEARQSPASTLHTWSSSDMEFYHAVAKRLSSGDWLLDTAMQPYHGWHDDMARLLFEKHPQTAQSYYTRFPKADSPGGEIDTLAARKAYMSDLLGGKTFYQDPLYAYLVAFTYRLMGPDPHWVYVWQMLLGSLLNALVFVIGRMLMGPLTGLLGAVLVMLSGPILVYEMTLLRSTLTAFLTVALLYAYTRLLRQNGYGNAGLLGITAGLSMLNQSYFIAFWLPALLWLAWRLRSSGRPMWKIVGATTAAWLITLSPLFYRNACVGAPLFAFSGAGPIIYVSYNGPTAHPLEPNFWDAQKTVELFDRSGNSLSGAIHACLSAFESTADLWRVYKEKLQGLFIWMEIPNNISYYIYREFSSVLAALPAPYYWVAPLGIVGIVLGFWNLRKDFIPYAFLLATSALPLFLSTSVARYRTPFVVLITLLAAYAMVVFAKSLLERRLKAVALIAVLAVGAAAFTFNIRRRDYFPYYPNDILPFYLIHYSERLVQLEKEKRYDEYTALLGECLDYLPDYFHRLNIHSRLYQTNEANCCEMVARLFRMQSLMLTVAGRPEEGRKHEERAQILQTLAEDLRRRLERKKQ